MGSATGIVEPNFPAAALVPKAETGVVSFLQKYPSYDGRSVTIAIFDSGVDPLAAGLQTLVDGKEVKVIERFDCSGCGDTETTTKVIADDKGYIVGISGRKLKLTSEMISTNNVNGEYRVGLKSFWDLYPSKVRENQMNTLKHKTFNKQNKSEIANVSRKINEFEAENPNPSKLSWDKKLIKENLDNTLEILNRYDNLYSDIRISYDCVLYQTDNGWKAVIDITENGDLENAVHIGEYSKTHEIKTINEYLSLSINVHDEGDVLELVGMCSPHGTHVASIASGNHSCKHMNGVAPNAKIVSLTIGDGRLGSMETGAALVRGMMKVMQMCREGRQIDVINMSYGEHSHWSSSGRIGELMSEVVNKYGVVWVASAGNHGPALSTVGTPPDINQPSCIGVGAYVSPQMMEAEYVLREKLPANVYTWTSRDPCIDGGYAVTVCAPGGAITSVPQFTMCKSQLMNGTSMAAPHVAGAIALLISGLKQKNIAYTPFSIKRALTATATKLSYVDPFAQGSGLLNVEKAFEHLVEYANSPENMIRFSVRCGVESTKGIHIRDTILKTSYECNVNVEPKFGDDQEVDAQNKINFNIRLNLVPSHSFVQCGSYLDLSYASRSIAVKIDPTGLPPGVHSAVINAYDTNCVQKGSIFEIPITVVQPHVINVDETRTFEPSGSKSELGIEFQPNTIHRDFILVPKNATWAVLRIRSTEKSPDKELDKFFVHTMQLLPRSSCRVMETMKMLDVRTQNNSTLVFKCEQNNILELCIAKYWSNFGATHIKYSLEFHGIVATNDNPFIQQFGRGVQQIVLKSFSNEEIVPTIILNKAVVVLKPSDTKISPLSATRDVIPEGRQIYQNLLTYNLHIHKTQEIAIMAPLFNSLLYESEFESQLWMIFDVNKVMITSGDAHSHKFNTKLEKGDYTVKLQIRHEKRELLDKISEATIMVFHKLAAPVALDIYDQYNQCVVSGKKYINGMIKENQQKVLYVGTLTQEKLNKANLPPNIMWLSGSFSLVKDDVARRIDSHDYTYLLGPTDKKNGNSTANANPLPSKNGAKSTADAVVAVAATSSGDGVQVTASPTNSESGSPKKNKVSSDDYLESLRDFQCTMISKCELERSEQIYNEIIAAHPKHLLAHLLLLQNIESTELKPQYPFTFVRSITSVGDSVKVKVDGKDETKTMRATLERIIQLADTIIKDTDKDALLAFYGLKYDPRPDATKIKSNMDKQKNTLIEGFAKKGIALIKLAILDGNLKEKSNELDEIYSEILKYVEVNDSKVIHFALWYAYSKSHFGRMYKLITKLNEEKKTKEAMEESGLIFNALNFEHIEVVHKRFVISSFPSNYRLF